MNETNEDYASGYTAGKIDGQTLALQQIKNHLLEGGDFMEIIPKIDIELELLAQELGG